MPRKTQRGYYVRGHFVAEGSDLDLELKREAKGDTDRSKTDLKRESEQLQKLGEALLTLRADLMTRLRESHDLPDKLIDALAEARRITDFEGRRRQMQYIGKLMRTLSQETVTDIEAALEEQRRPSARETVLLHQAEQWRDRLIGDDAALTDWLDTHPEADVQHLRTLIRQARKDAQGGAALERPGEARRHGRAYRDLFQIVRTALAGQAADEKDDNDEEATP
ncbi:MAG: DUF615 domain-containing protein [Burkholderiales bacterium]|nr:MAG: DUF615 domain-containing protein [Burkholderiales bacterium]